MPDEYLPRRVNSGPWIIAYTLDYLQQLPGDTEFVLPVCSLGTPYELLAHESRSRSNALLLPPLFHEALDADLKREIIQQILRCFPIYAASGGCDNAGRVRIVELPQAEYPPRPQPKILTFSVDTGVEEHGPHLPLGTDTIQSYGVLRRLRGEIAGLKLGHPLDYGQLTWGLPFGYSVDLTAALLTRYVSGYANAVTNWLRPELVYVVDVHGSITHRSAIVEGLRQSDVSSWAFRWLHEPLAEFASERGDQHAGGVETALVEFINRELLDKNWWPARLDDIARQQMSFDKAVELTSDLTHFTDYVNQELLNGVVGDIRNYHDLNAQSMFDRMLEVARGDIDRLLRGEVSAGQNAGERLW